MTIEKLKGDKVLISLCNEDMKDFSLSFESLSLCDGEARRVLLRLLSLAVAKAGLSLKERTVLLEALPHQGGCLILATLIEKARERRVYKVKRIREYPCFAFDNAEAFLSAAERIGETASGLYGNSLWLWQGRYYLLFDYPVVATRGKAILSQYGKSFSAGGVSLARIRESGKLICGANALLTVGRALDRDAGSRQL